MDRFFKATIIENHKINPVTAIITLKPQQDFIFPQPGQFFMLQVSRGVDPLLKRPLSIFSIKTDYIHFLYRIVGRGTECLSNLSKGEVLELIGPLGRHYPIPDDKFIAIAGGTGIASIHGILERYPQRAYLFYGAKDSNELIIRDMLEKLAYKTIVTTDDGSHGMKGNVLYALDNFNPPDLPIYACGPKGMLTALSEWAKQKQTPTYVSLEEYMACGIGACLSCAIKTVNGLKSVCKDGPVFDIQEIIW